MDFGGTAGLSNVQTGYIPNHIVSKKSHYVLNINCKVMQFMSGFRLEDKY